MMDRKKRLVELKICKQFVRCFNAKYGKTYLEPQLTFNREEFPDCIVNSIVNPKISYELEVTTSSPQEAKGLGKYQEYEVYREWRGEYLDGLNNIIGSQLYEILNLGKAAKYPKNVKVSLILLLEGANINYEDKDIALITSRFFPADEWQKKLKMLGFKEIWYVSTKDIFKFYPL